mmetsp:Transcript_55177/g.118455  ORF Transcript_55177/g.118455 Transcript_55177/m.118455 type:complete len:103 (-) Transcript_55177:3-311(-)
MRSRPRATPTAVGQWTARAEGMEARLPPRTIMTMGTAAPPNLATELKINSSGALPLKVVVSTNTPRSGVTPITRPQITAMTGGTKKLLATLTVVEQHFDHPD